MNMSQRQLSMFVTTATLAHVTQASEALHISQPALTRALKAFEAQLGCQLFARTTRRVSLTREGALLLPRAQALLRQMSAAQDALSGRRGSPQGTVSIAVGSAFGCTVLPLAVSDLAARHPGIRLRILDDNSQGITTRVARAEVDIGIGSLVGRVASVSCEKLLSAPLGLLGQTAQLPTGKSVRMGDVRGARLLKEPDDTSIAHLLATHGSDLLSQMDCGTEVSSLAIQLAMAQAGAGFAVLSALGASHPQATGLRFLPLSPRLHREVFLMHHLDHPADEATTVTCEAIRSALIRATLHASVKRQPLAA
ncbi:MAG: LysR family carnitine catabolism transcriptional activator [Hydrogenophaga sp.]|jgi:LysR family carnitine catabolism transcriptional activator